MTKTFLTIDQVFENFHKGHKINGTDERFWDMFIEFGVLNHVVVQQIMRDEEYWFEVYLNGNRTYSVINAEPKIYGNVYVFVGAWNSWEPNKGLSKGVYTNFHLETVGKMALIFQ